ncbi:MAG: M24 family metallopeptidase [Acidobacteria bacterium]|nr:M24 family metallopeptidase [Acidobacteriota bacterium]
MNLPLMQDSLRACKIDGWLFYDFHHSDRIAYEVLGLATDRMATRPWYYLVPAQGAPLKLVHRIEESQLDSLPGEKMLYVSRQEQTDLLRQMLHSVRTIAMQYSPHNQIPYLSRVDAGTVELVRSFGKQVVTSADLVQRLEACWTAEAYQMHLEAGRKVDAMVQCAFGEIGRRIIADGSTDEYVIQQFLLEQFQEYGLVTEDRPLVAVNQNSGNPHHQTRAGRPAPIRAGDFILLDVWAKQDKPGAVYYDVTWVGFAGEDVPEKIQEVFALVKAARDRAIQAVQEAVRQGRTIRGFEVDRVARQLIADHGYGQYFTHRTGHSLGRTVHGNGANMDDLETHDEREIIPFTAFSIEPGIYLPEFGVRSEVNVFVEENDARVTGAIQNELVRIPADCGLPVRQYGN